MVWACGSTPEKTQIRSHILNIWDGDPIYGGRKSENRWYFELDIKRVAEVAAHVSEIRLSKLEMAGPVRRP